MLQYLQYYLSTSAFSASPACPFCYFWIMTIGARKYDVFFLYDINVKRQRSNPAIKTMRVRHETLPNTPCQDNLCFSLRFTSAVCRFTFITYLTWFLFYHRKRNRPLSQQFWLLIGDIQNRRRILHFTYTTINN